MHLCFRMNTRVRDLAVEAVGWALLALAVIAFPLPVLPTLLLLAALLMLSPRHSWAQRLLAKIRRLFPSFIRSRNSNATLQAPTQS